MNALTNSYVYANDDDYFALENDPNNREKGLRYEMIDGLIYAMSGGSLNHSRIIRNLLSNFDSHLRGKPCEVFAENVRVKMTQKIGRSDYVYPDLVVDCTPQKAENNMLTTPVLIVEVLSNSTRHKDENAKFHAYIQIPTVQEYVIIEQDVAKIEIQRRRTNWTIEKFLLGDNVTFESIGLTVKATDIYEKVENGDVNNWLEQLENSANLSAIRRDNND